ncbi:MAG: hypothetical protein H6R13_1715 [Proteobacteria bacterium]|nr:hypothetical protein [Pseudomonadota bacterium]
MFLSAHEIAQSREHALSNLLGLSATCIDATRRLAELLSSSSREAIHHGSKHLALFGHGQLESMTQFPATAWLENTARASRLLDSSLDILGETQKAMIRSAEAQVRVFDEMVFAVINRASKSSPWEAEIALKAMKTTLQGAEQTLHNMSDAAIETVALAEHEAHQVVETLTESKPAVRKRAAVRNTSK